MATASSGTSSTNSAGMVEQAFPPVTMHSAMGGQCGGTGGSHAGCGSLAHDPVNCGYLFRSHNNTTTATGSVIVLCDEVAE